MRSSLLFASLAALMLGSLPALAAEPACPRGSVEQWVEHAASQGVALQDVTDPRAVASLRSAIQVPPGQVMPEFQRFLAGPGAFVPVDAEGCVLGVLPMDVPPPGTVQ